MDIIDNRHRGFSFCACCCIVEYCAVAFCMRCAAAESPSEAEMTKIFEAKNHILIHASYADPKEHRHMAAHIIISVGGSMRVAADGNEYLCRGVMIPSGVPHAVDTGDQPALVFLYDCTTNVAREMKTVQCIPEAGCDEIIAAYSVFEQNITSDHYIRLEKCLLKQLGQTESIRCVNDDRIRSAMRYIRSAGWEEISIKDVADAVSLSAGRFSHLFREQVGMTFAAYVIYQRIMRVYAGVFRGVSITDAALDAGFASSAHFADVNRRVFGISASRIRREISFIKVQ